MRPKVSFNSKNIWRRLEACKTVAQAYGWDSRDIMKFSAEVSEAFSYEEAMAVIKRNFDTVEDLHNQSGSI
jgi:acyl carrier protein